MDFELLKQLSNADSIASNEKEVRDIMVEFCESISDEVFCDNLGSVIFKKNGSEDGPKIMLCSHMDEVGFMVRSVSNEGMIFLITVGGVKELSKYMQKVRVTTSQGKKIKGILNATYDNGTSKDIYMDIGATTAQEVYDLGIQVGDMVTFDVDFEEFDLNNIVCGKSFDDRLGCYIMAEVLKRLSKEEHKNTVYMAGTSSEEVGIRGAKTAVHKVDPDVIFVLDVACFSNEFIRNHTNCRQIGKGVMLTHFDRTLAPNKKMIELVKNEAKNIKLNLQLDMFNNGGTDGGEAHKINDGKPTVVTCLPVRYGHCGYSIANTNDIEDCINLYVEIIKNFNIDTYKDLINFLGR